MPKDILIIKKNMKSILDQGGGDKDIEEYIKSEGFEPENFLEGGAFYSNKLKPAQYDELQNVVGFENTKLGKAVLSVNKVLNFLPSTGYKDFLPKLSELSKDVRPKSSELAEVFELENERERMTQVGKLLSTTKKVVGDYGRVLPYLAAGGGSIPLNMAKQAGVVGVGRFLQGAGEGESLEDTAKAGALTGGAAAALTGAIPVTGKLIKGFAKAVVKAGSRVRNYAIDAAIKDSSIITQPQPLVIDIGTDIANYIDDYAKNVSLAFEKGLDDLDIPLGKTVKLDFIKTALKKYDLDPKKITSILKTAAAKEASTLDDVSIAKFVNGAELPFYEARKINSLLHNTVNTGKGEAIGSGVIGKLSDIKSNLLSAMDDSVSGIKNLNKKYAEGVRFYKDLKKKFSDPARSEALLKTVGQQLEGVNKNKTGLIRDLVKLEEEVGVDFLGQLRKSLAAEEFERHGMNNLMSYLKLGGGASVGASVGGPVGAAVGSAVSVALESPEVTKGLIRGGLSIGKVTQSPALQQLLRTSGVPAAQSIGQSLNSIVFKRPTANQVQQ